MMVALAADIAASTTRQGQARVIDGDTLAIGGVVVRLHGIDAPERDQICGGEGRGWPCGTWAQGELSRLIAGRQVLCAVVDTDRFGREVAVCQVGTSDLGGALVMGGAALAYRRYSRAYVAQELAARQARRGLWRSEGDDFQTPADWRATLGGTQEQREGREFASDDCDIKGNISAVGRVYHQSGQSDYDRTRIDVARGERWFRSEADAQAAGWRAARR